VGNDWKIDYACTGYNDGTGIGGNFSVEVDGSDNSYIDLAVNEICPAGKNTTGETEEHQGGDVYLNISADGGGWVVQVRVDCFCIRLSLIWPPHMAITCVKTMHLFHVTSVLPIV
jgi:hypothetical protein